MHGLWHTSLMEKENADKAENVRPQEPKGTKSDTPPKADDESRPKEVGGRGGLDPTRYGDWEKNGRCIDF